MGGVVIVNAQRSMAEGLDVCRVAEELADELLERPAEVGVREETLSQMLAVATNRIYLMENARDPHRGR